MQFYYLDIMIKRCSIVLSIAPEIKGFVYITATCLHCDNQTTTKKHFQFNKYIKQKDTTSKNLKCNNQLNPGMSFYLPHIATSCHQNPIKKLKEIYFKNPNQQALIGICKNFTH